ncbi:peptidylprolyl isomerase [Panacibacter sp. DH6]|uniref:peptidylprolyl isomerase n=1 Tax=Panacibacter microcysteis TaxID=2793269 RepID=A0A931E9D4_9BACT|nr:peptidylprolyl isomerase [Panacibacter microcysteis]MBG9376111.1 peptidylprolyl isomerase [Panacibacter microcysteis]
MKKLVFVFLVFALAHTTFAQTAKPKTTTAPKTTTPVAKGRLVQLTTDYGTMVIRLYDSTPLHRDNFIKLVKQGFYDSLMFHRIIQQFMIQGGDPDSKNAEAGQQLGAGSAPGAERIPAEFRSNLIHKKGALAAARDNNPDKASSNCQFYIVQGQTYNDTALNMMECNVRQEDPGFRFTDAQRKIYKTIGGTPFLDQNYTVFGEVIKGLDVLDKIAALPKDGNDRPTQDVRMKMKMLN